MRPLGDALFGAVPLVGIEDGMRTCSNGLPITPAAVRMLGRFSKLTTIEHPNLCQYIELIRCHLAANSVILVSEHYQDSIVQMVKDGMSSIQTHNVASQLVSAVDYLHKQEIAIGFLDLHSLLLVPSTDEHIHIRLSQYGLGRVSCNGKDVDYVIGSPYTLSPERLADPNCTASVSQKADVWAVGMVILQMIVGTPICEVWSYKQFFNVIMSAIVRGTDDSVLPTLLSALKGSGKLQKPVNDKCELMDIVKQCLNKKASMRPTSEHIKNVLLKDKAKQQNNTQNTWTYLKDQIENSSSDWVLRELPIRQAFFLWKLCGSSVESLLIGHDIIQLQQPITTTPSVVVNDFRQFGNEDARMFRVKYEPCVLPTNNFQEKILAVNPRLLLHSFELDGDHFSKENLSVVVKEKDVYYQCARMKMTEQIIRAVAFKPETLRKLVTSDIPPMIRSDVWTALLGVSTVDVWIFDSLDTVSAHSSDRQLDVDIPRCHQYEEMMTSPAAHVRLKRLLKAWLRAHPKFVYWQGLDSLTAPFMLLHFEDLPKALACLTAFIDKYLLNFFLQENSAVIQEYLAVFNHLVAYVDAPLYTCMKEMDFFPELFAIPWFLTCFAHVLPLHKLFHVWDALLLGDASYPLFVGLAVLRQLRPRLIESNFNDAILLFSDLPDLNMEKVINDSVDLYSIVPPSCAYRSQGSDRVKTVVNPYNPREFTHTMADIAYNELKLFDCPRLSREELIWRVEAHTILVIDLRSQAEFNRGSIVSSLNYPNPSDLSLLNIKCAIDSAIENKHPICIVDGGRMEMAYQFASVLVRSGISYVCVLDGGFNGIRNCQTLLKAN